MPGYEEKTAGALPSRSPAGPDPRSPGAQPRVEPVSAAGSAPSSRGAEDAAILANQSNLKNTDQEIPALEGALLATRQDAMKRGLLSPASFDAGLALTRAMARLQPVIAADGTVDGLTLEQAAIAAQQLFLALHRETGGDESFKPSAALSRGGATVTQNRYTEETRISTWLSSSDLGSALADLPGLLRAHAWRPALDAYRRLITGLDLWVADQLRSSGKGTPDEARGHAQEHHAQLRAGLEQIADKHATRLPALFHPDAEILAKEKAAGRPVADAIPMNVYFWKEDGAYHLYDLTTPGRPHEQRIDGEPDAARLQTFFEEVARYPEGSVRYVLPSGAGGVAATTGKTKWYEWAGYVGLALAAAGLAVLTAGASVAATACFAAGAVAGGISAGGHLVDSARLGTATAGTIALDVAQIVTSFASSSAMSIVVRAGGTAAALAGSRWFVPLLGVAARAGVVELVALTDVTYVELRSIQRGVGLPEDKQRAMAIVLTQALVAGGLAALSVHGARNARALAGQPLELVEQDGVKILRVIGEDTGVPESKVKGSEHGAAGSKSVHDIDPGAPPSVAMREAEAHSQRSLGEDPAIGKFRQNEMDTAVRLEATTGARLERFHPPPGRKGDWRDTNTGLVYDGCSPGPEPYFNKGWNKYTRSLDDHLSHPAVDRVVVDVTNLNLTPAQLQQLERHLASLPAHQQPKIVRIGF